MNSTHGSDDRTRFATSRERKAGRVHARTLLPLASVAVLVALVGCSSTKTDHRSAAPAGPTNVGAVGGADPAPATISHAQGAKPCDLLTVEEIKTATGLMAEAGKSEGEDSIGCTWVIDSADAGKSTVSVDLFEPSLYPGLAPGAAEPVSGVGDAALWASGLWTLYVHAGQRAFSVQVVLLSVKQQPIAQALARNVLAHLS